MPLDLNRPVQTRDGRKVRILCTDARSLYPVVALVEMTLDTKGAAKDEMRHYRLDGSSSPLWGHGSDLINVPERLTGWVNIYPHREVGRLYPTREAADNAAATDRIGVAYIDTEKLP